MGQQRRVQISTTLTARRKQHAAAQLPRPLCTPLAICKRCHGGYKNTFTAGSRLPSALSAGPPLRHSRVWDHILTACQNMLQLSPAPALPRTPLDTLLECIALESFSSLLSHWDQSVARRKEPQVYDVICSFMRHTNKVA